MKISNKNKSNWNTSTPCCKYHAQCGVVVEIDSEDYGVLQRGVGLQRDVQEV